MPPEERPTGTGTDTGLEMFEAAVERALGARLRSDDAICRDLWSALANVAWSHADAGTIGCTFRRASETVAAIRGWGHPLEWHCSGPDAVVSRGIADAMAREGWTPRGAAE